MIKNFLKSAAVASIFVAGTVFAMDYAFSIPVVYKSYSTNECVGVDNYPGLVFGKTEYSCESMPEKYELSWVK